jgi:hypothetical protein
MSDDAQHDELVQVIRQVYVSDDYPALASLATGAGRFPHMQAINEAARALNEIAGLREDLAAARRHE